MHGVHPKAKAAPINGGAHAPTSEGLTWSRRSTSRKRGDTNPARNTPIAITNAPATSSSARWCSRNAWPRPLAAAPRATNTAVKPATKRSVERTIRRRFPGSPSWSSATLMPETSDKYPGTSGSTHGERNESMPPPKAPITPGSWTSTASITSAAAELWRSPFPEGRHALGQVLARPRPVEGGVELLLRRPVERQLVSGDRQRRQGGDLGGPSHGRVQVAEPLHQTEAMGLLPADDVGCEQHRPGRSLTGQRREAVHGPPVDHQPQFGGGDAELGSGCRHAQVAGHRQLRAGSERRAVDGRDNG